MSFGEYVSFSTIDKVLAEGGPLFVRNTSRHTISGASSILVISYMAAEGQTAFNCPRVNIPFNICDHVDPEGLRGSRSFRKLVNSGILEIVPEEKAVAELQDPMKMTTFRAALRESDEHGIYQVRATEIKANKAAEDAIKAEKNASQSAGMSHMLASMDPRLASVLSANSPEDIINVPLPEFAPNPRFRALESRLQGMAGSTVVSELTLMYGDLSPNDIQAVATGAAWPAEAKTWARERIAYSLAALSATAESAALEAKE